MTAEVPVITPFWQRIPLFFRYPLHAEPLLYMAALSLATLIGLILPLPSPLDQTSLGLLTPEQHRFYDAGERANLPYKQFAVFFVAGFVISLAGGLGEFAVGLVMIFFVLSMPASIMILSITQSFRAGLNPLAAIGMMRVIGLPYLGLCAFLFLLSSSQGILQMALLPRVPDWMLIPLLNFVAMYFTLIMFNMMGYVVYQYHAPLGVGISAAAPVAATAADTVDAIGQLIGAGQLDAALELAYEAQRVAPGDVKAHDRYHNFCCWPAVMIARCRMRAAISACCCKRGAASRRSISIVKCWRATPRLRPSCRRSCCSSPRRRVGGASMRRRWP